MEKKKESLATIGLLFITFLAAIQFVFLQNVPDTVPSFAFLCITNVIGFLVVGLVQIKKVLSIQKKTLFHGLIFALELTGMNFFVLLGAQRLDAVIVSSLMSLYFVFVTPLLLFMHKRVNFFSSIASVVAVIALLLMFGADTDTLFGSRAVIYLIIADVFFAAYVVSVSVFAEDEDGVQLSFAQMVFAGILSLIGWIIESGISGKGFSLPADTKFWISTVFIGIFIRALYGIIQISCQKHVPALKASLIFSSEIIITLVTTPVMCLIFGTVYTPVTPFQVIGCFLFIVAALMIDEGIMRKFGYEDMQISGEGKKSSVSKKIILTTLSFALVTLILQAVISMSSIHFIRNSSIDGSTKLGETAARISSNAILNQLEKNVSRQAEDKSQLAEQKLAAYSDSIQFAADYAHSLYCDPTGYPKKPVFPPAERNSGSWSMQRGLADEGIKYEDIEDKIALMGNMIDVFDPIVTQNKNAATIYLGTEDGFMISYDKYSFDVDGELYYNFFESGWYTSAKEANAPVFTDTYLDGFGRGLTITCAAPFYDRYGKFAGCVAVDILMGELNEAMVNDGIVIPNYAMLIDNEGNYISGFGIDTEQENPGSIFDIDKDISLRESADEILSKKNGIVISGEGDRAKYIAFSSIDSTGWILCILSPVSEVIVPAQTIQYNIDTNTEQVVDTVTQSILTIIQSFLVLSAMILILVTFLAGRVSKRISDPIIELEKDVRSISDGNLENRTNVDTDDEIGSLARSFNHMTDSLQQYIKDLTEVTAKEQRIAGELGAATHIQASLLPRNFDEINAAHREFDLYASMDPAKEVGGDFYDFFMVDDSHLALVMADVTGKGVPAALFMVRSKTIIKNRALMGGSPAEVLSDANEQLCEGNEGTLFVTVWMAIIDLATGKGIASNAGHEHPVVMRAGSDYEYVKYQHSPAVAVMEGVRFREHEFEMHPGDRLFVYTDGVLEAINTSDELYGEQRLLVAMNRTKNASTEEIIRNVKEDIDAFALGAPQFDDITMLVIDWHGV
ncbi:MAG: SpoIIE family protein phosphatase [Lachnospiraceae bacterium]|nr:SpoIIE family protein phosphatase [Lachnospiraceae bacterium]